MNLFKKAVLCTMLIGNVQVSPLVYAANAVAASASTSTTAPPTPPTPLQPSETLQRIVQKGVVVVGVKTDYRPFGHLDANGSHEGLERDLASDIAKRLGVRLETVSVSSANRLQRLEEGAIDLVIATMGDTADRRRITTTIEPNYYSSGTTLLMGPEHHFKEWAEVRGKPVCAVQGSYQNRPMAQRYLLDLVIFNNARDAKLALRNGRCVGYLFDNTGVQNDLASPEWAGYSAPLPPAMVVPWGLAIARSEQGTDFERILGDTVAQWHREGFLLAREKAWKLPESKFLKTTHDLWNKQKADGTSLCVRQPDGHWIAACRNPAFLTTNDVDGLRALGLWFRELTSLDVTIAYDEYDRNRFIKGLLLTISLMIACMLGSLGMGVLGTFAANANVRGVKPMVRLLAVYGRMTPTLAQMYALYFGVSPLLQANFGFSLHPFFIAVWCFCFYTGSFIMTALMDGIDHLRETQPDFRLTVKTLKVVLSTANGAVKSAMINTAKGSMLASAIAVPELLATSTAIMTDNGNTAVMMNALLVAFFILIAITIRIIEWADRRFISNTGKAT
jgi:polar amino acid transport system substrate-binding protein